MRFIVEQEDTVLEIAPNTIPIPPKLGMVISTFSAVPYVHLHLEARKRLYPEVPCLVHDDGSRSEESLHQLCKQYGAEFSRNRERLGHVPGDLSAYWAGLKWAKCRGLDILVKFSRRWIPTSDWRPSLIALVEETDYPTYSNWTTTFNFGFRTECIGMAVELWTCMEVLQELEAAIASKLTFLVEAFLHQLAKKLTQYASARAMAYDKRQPRPSEKGWYAVWEWMGQDRCKKSDRWLWHDCNPPEDYAALAKQWGLPYGIEDFRDPNKETRLTNLEKIYEKYRHLTDKGTIHSYLGFYEQILGPLRYRPITLVEIGVDKGGSLQLWKDYLHPESRIIGVNIKPPLPLSDKIEQIQADATKPGDWIEQIGLCDVVIDDASHNVKDQIATWKLLWPRLRPGGIYVIEDVQNDNACKEILFCVNHGHEEDFRSLKNRYDDRLIWIKKI